MIERMAGADATMWHLQRPTVFPHTLKTAVLDVSALGRQLTLHDIRAGLEPRLGLLPRATQRVVAVPGFPGRPFWVTDEDFDICRHLDAVTLPPPGGRAELDALQAELMSHELPHDRPLWAATLVNGLPDGRQALVVRVHHAITDGIGALNTFLRLTTDDPATAVPVAPPAGESPEEDASVRALRRQVLRNVPSLVTDLGPLVRDGFASSRRARAFRREHPQLPAMVGARRTFLSEGNVSDRVCATFRLDFAPMRAIASAAGVTINGVYHALIAAALWDEFILRGQDNSAPSATSFAVVLDASDHARLSGNLISPAVVNVYSNIADPVERLRNTARSCREGVELRKLTGVEMAGRWSQYTCRLAALFVRVAGERSPRIVNHLVTANVPGPQAFRHAGPVVVEDWVSHVFTAYPANINVTTYSYAGHLSVGLVATPHALPDPYRFLQRMATEVEVLGRALGCEGATVTVPPDGDGSVVVPLARKVSKVSKVSAASATHA